MMRYGVAALARRSRRGVLECAIGACILLALSACAAGRNGRYVGTLSTQSGLCGLSASATGQTDGQARVQPIASRTTTNIYRMAFLARYWFQNGRAFRCRSKFSCALSSA